MYRGSCGAADMWTADLDKERQTYYSEFYSEEEYHELDVLRRAKLFGIEIPTVGNDSQIDSEEMHISFTEEQIKKAQAKSRMKEMQKEKSRRKKAKNRK
jgi:hypothetical protein